MPNGRGRQGNPWTHVPGLTGIPRWVDTRRRRFPYDGSETCWDQINWILHKPVKTVVPIPSDVSAETSAAATSGLLQLLRTDRQRPQALARGGKYRVAEGRGNQWHGGFADAAGRLVAVHQMHV